MKKHFITASIAIVVLAFDFFSKLKIEASLGIGERIDVIGSFVQFTRIYNEGGVFGILQGYKNFFLVVSLLVLVALVFFYCHEKIKTNMFIVAMGLIFGGACGNIMDRLLGKKGVVDFVYIGVDNVYRWPAFNVADSCIVVGAFLLVILFFCQERALKKMKNGNN